MRSGFRNSTLEQGGEVRQALPSSAISRYHSVAERRPERATIAKCRPMKPMQNLTGPHHALFHMTRLVLACHSRNSMQLLRSGVGGLPTCDSNLLFHRIQLIGLRLCHRPQVDARVCCCCLREPGGPNAADHPMAACPTANLAIGLPP